MLPQSQSALGSLVLLGVLAYAFGLSEPPIGLIGLLNLLSLKLHPLPAPPLAGCAYYLGLTLPEMLSLYCPSIVKEGLCSCLFTAGLSSLLGYS
jgi:hypothetical protein